MTPTMIATRTSGFKSLTVEGLHTLEPDVVESQPEGHSLQPVRVDSEEY